MARRYASRMLDFSKGIIGGISDYGRKPRHLRIADNVLLRPFGGLEVRRGSQRASSATLGFEPHTLMEWVDTNGAARVFEGCKDTNGRLYRMQAASFTLQTTPFLLNASAIMSWDQLNGALWMTQNAGGNPPLMFRSNNPTDTFQTGILPRPAFMDIDAGTAISVSSVQAGAPTLAPGTTVTPAVTRGTSTAVMLSGNATGTGVATMIVGNLLVPNCRILAGSKTVWYEVSNTGVGDPMTLTAAVGGALTTVTDYFYRLRFRYLDGSSIASKAVHLLLAGAQNQINITNIVQEIRTDYVGWTLERTKPGGNANGPWYRLDDGTGATYNDTKADGDLAERTDPENPYTEPQHYDGLIAHRDRMFGWIGSVLYASQTIGDVQATGISNWNPKLGYEFGRDDGDAITCVIRQNDRLLVFKRWSVWALEGYDTQSFTVVPIYQGAGASGPRCAGSMGSRAWFFGEAGLHVIDGNSVKPFGWEEVGHIFDKMARPRFADVVIRNYLGQLLVISFSTGSARNDAMLVYDQRFGGWTRFTNWFAQDILVQKIATFGDTQSMLFCDTRDRDPGGGFDYRTWIGFYNYKDEKAADGTGGVNVTVALQTPGIDDGTPDVLKDYNRVEMLVSAGVTTPLSLIVTAEPSADSRAFSATLSPGGVLWGSAIWGTFKWGRPLDQTPFSGLASGLFGTRYHIDFTASCSSSFQFKGYILDAILLPERRLS